MANPTFERDRLDTAAGRVGSIGRSDDELRSVEGGRTNPDAFTDQRHDRDRSIGSLIQELRDESSKLLQQEVALAKTELSEKAGIYARNAAAVAAGGAVAHAGGMVLLFGLTIALYFGLTGLGLSHTLAGILAFAGVGSIGALIGYSMIKKGLTRIKNESPVPQQTVQSLKEDKQWLTNQVK